MPPRKKIIRSQSGWLVYPASLILLIAPAVAGPAGAGDRIVAGAVVAESPEQELFSENADFVVLTFFDLYCLACQQSAENFNLLHERLKQAFPNNLIQVTGVGIGDTDFELGVFLRKYKLTYESRSDPGKSFEKPFAVRGTPTVLVFAMDKSSRREIFRHEGRFRETDIEKLIREISN